MENKEYSLSFCKGNSAKMQGSENTQRQQVFRTRCTIAERVCELFINGGSCSNLASSYLVERLSLPTLDHPNPYNLKWLDAGSYLKVEKQVWVELSIGKVYKDKVLCDVLPMDDCHVLLGRPWEFDRGTMRNGRLNTYSFTFEGRKLTLISLPPVEGEQVENLETQGSVKNLFSGESDIHTKKDEVIFGAAPKRELDKGTSLTPLGVKGVWKEEPEETPSELPPSLPPSRWNEHHVDLVSGTILSNAPIEPMNLQKQPHRNLMNLRMAWKFLRPCSVPASLVQEVYETLRVCDNDKVLTNDLQKDEVYGRNHPKGGLNAERNDVHSTVPPDLGGKSDGAGLKVCVLGDRLMLGQTKEIKPPYFTPHFHHPTLIKLMNCLAYLGAIAYIQGFITWCADEVLGRNLGAKPRDGSTPLMPFTIFIYDPGGNSRTLMS